jgi:transcriptional regulator with GAF, ATPase, and Fis domain
MTLPAATVSASSSLPATQLSTPPPARSFADLDERVVTGAAGVLLVRTPSREVARSIAAHVARRVRAAGGGVVHAQARDGAPLWSEVAAQLGLAHAPCDPARCALEVAQVATARGVVILAPLPADGTWDRMVAHELSLLPSTPMVVLLTGGADACADLRVEGFDVSASLDPNELRRWWAAAAEDAHADARTEDLTKLEGAWSHARRTVAPDPVVAPHFTDGGVELFAALALAARAWPIVEIASLGGQRADVETLVAAGALRSSRGWVAIDAAFDARAVQAVSDASPTARLRVASALVARFHADAWAQARAAELLLAADTHDSADAAHAAALHFADDAFARREIVSRWMRALATLSKSAQLPLRTRAAERALALGEAEEAHRWAQTAATLAPDDAAVTLLFGQAAVAMGDLVAAKVALERGRSRTTDPETLAVIAVELAEVAYQSGDLETSAAEATRALPALVPATRLRARNTLGKILLAESKWDEADRHFAEDGWLASSAGETTAELRARLNRGIALLSKGHADEARAIFEGVLTEGERTGDARACAFALDNLAVIATWRHDYTSALTLSERTLKLRQRLGDRLAMARILANLAELRRKLGLLDHAEHAIAFGRRTLGPGMPPARSALFGLQAARSALMRGNVAEARREVGRAIADAEAAGMKSYMGEAQRISARIALDDGDLGRAKDAIGRACDLAATDEAHAEVALLAALHGRASGDNDERLALEALALARETGEEELLIEAHILVCEVHRANGAIDAARAHLDQAILLRDQVGDALPTDFRSAFLARGDFATLVRLQSALNEPEPLPVEPSRRAERSIRPGAATSRSLVGDDPAMRGLLAAIRKVAKSNSTILVRGESGTGKELVADAIHAESDRAAGPLVTVNCAALVETLLLSELFGHEKGAFTGAVARRRGRFELAEGGTLFLDEIGDISARTQVALLRVLQERTFERVGGTTPIRANVRIICATHRDLRAMVDRGEFREDLYYRLRGITLEVPPLRARMGDLPRIAENLLERIAAERGERPKSLTPDAIELLARHRWPGNVRELENALRASSLFADGDFITASTLADNVDDLRSVASASQLRRASYVPPSQPELDPDGEALDASVVEPLPSSESSATSVAYAQVRQGSVSLSDMKRQIERDCIARALAETRGNITRAAALLGMKRPRLSQLVKQYGLAAVSSEDS